MARQTSKPVAADVRRAPLSDSSPRVFRAIDLAHRYGVGPAIITRWRNDGRMPQPDTFTAEGTELGWSPSCLSRIEAESDFLRGYFQRAINMPVSDP